MAMPNFLIIGAAKSGTTSLYYYLKQHPQIYMSPIKEPSFFAFEGEEVDFRGANGQSAPVNRFSVTDLEAYQRLFSSVSDETAIGEASVWYLYSSKAPERIHHYIPDVKLVAILRNPIDRAYSSFMHLMRGGNEPISDFAQALQAEETRIRDNWGLLWRYKQVGFYREQLERYFELFDPGQIKVYLYEDYKINSVDILQDIFQFLGVHDTFVPDISAQHNISGVPRSKAMYLFLSRRNRIKDVLKPFMSIKLRRRIVASLQRRNLVKPPLSPEVRQQLIKVYKKDILELQELIQRDLAKWLE